MFRAVRGLTRDIVTVAAGAWFSAKNNDGTKQLRSRIAGHRKTIEYVDRWFDENLPILKRCESRLSHEFRNAVAWVRSQRPSDPATEDAHSDDFRSVRWQGQTYSFTAKQAPAIKLLWEHREKGTTDVADETLLLAIDEQAPPANLRTLFRGHPAWSTMIVAGGSKGTHRLA